MSFQFQIEQSTTKNFRRILNEQSEAMIEALQGEDIDTGVHQARKAMKRTRALLRLVHEPLSKKNFRRENQFYRDLARGFAGARDGYVLLKTLDRLVTTYSDDEQLAAEVVAPVRQHLEHDYETRHQQSAAAGIDEAIQQLKAAQQRSALMKLDNSGFADVEGGLRLVYSSGRVHMRRAVKHPSAENLHEWRKDVKYLWHQVELLSPMWQPVLDVYAGELHTLADYLGDDHDYAVLRQTLFELPTEVADGELIYTLTRLIERERVQLQQQAFQVGACLYAEETYAFIERLRSYWDVWQATGQLLVTDR